jgi:cold shock CspA family protein
MAIADQVDDEREDAFSHVKEIELSRNDAILEADQVLAEIVRANRRATAGELAYFQSELRWDERQVKSELRRMGNVLRDRAIAGTASDRAAAQAEAEVADGILQREGVKVAAKITELQSKLASMERDAKLSAQRVADQAEAVERLRNNAPEHIRQAVRHRENELTHGAGRQLSDAEIRHNELCCNLDPSRYPTEAAYLESLRMSCREAIEDYLAGSFRRFRLSQDWPSIRVKLEAERDRLTSEIAKLKAEIAEQEAAIREQLDYYTKKGDKHDQ